LEQIEKGFVEPPHTAKPGSQRNVRHGQFRLLNELLSEKDAANLRDRFRCGSKMLFE
jgi:hypothetical protein